MLTKIQKDTLDFIKAYSKKNGYSPTQEEIAKHFRRSLGAINERLHKIKDAGEIRINKNQRRGIEILGSNPMVQVPLLGTIVAGRPLTLFDVPSETIAVPKNKIPRSSEVYALRVEGDSMIEEGIKDGDIILVRHQSTAENGQKVVALIDGSEATLKRFYKERNHIRLQPANKGFEPIIIKKGKQDIEIRGVVLEIIKGAKEQFPELITKNTPKEISLPKPYYKKPGFKLYRANCLNVLEGLPEESVDMIFADPPYNLSNGGFTVHAGKMVSVNKGNWDKSKGFKDDYNFHYEWLKACRRVLKPNGTLWVSGTYHSIYQCGHALQALDYHILNDITWFKPNASPNLSCRYFTASHESLIWARKEKKAKHIFNYKLMKTGNWSEDNLKKPGLQMRSVWSLGTPKPIEKKFGKHPTQKPESLLKRIVLASTNKGDLIVDPFTGSSTTGVAAYLYGRNFIGIDTDSEFLDLSIERFEELDRNLKNKN